MVCSASITKDKISADSGEIAKVDGISCGMLWWKRCVSMTSLGES
jgi:hypothetical protein